VLVEERLERNEVRQLVGVDQIGGEYERGDGVMSKTQIDS